MADAASPTTAQSIPSLELQWLHRQAVRSIVRKVLGDPTNTFSARHVDAKIWSHLRSAILVPRDLPTIAAAVQAAPAWPPCNILISPGVYKETLILDKPVHLLGLRRQLPGSSAAGEGAEAAAEGAESQRVAVQYPEQGGSAQTALMKVLSANSEVMPTIRNLDCHGSLWVADGSGAVIQGCCFSASSNVGVFVSQSASVVVQDSTFVRCAGGGVVLRDTCHATIERCSFEANGLHGVQVSHSAAAAIRGNSFKETIGPAILLRSSEGGGSGSISVESNTIESSKGSGIQVCGHTEAALVSNVLKRHKMAAIAFQASGRGSVLRNILEDNYGLGIWVGGSATPSVEGNKVRDNLKAKVIEFTGELGTAVRARVVSNRDDPQNQLTHELEYISGAAGREWVGLDEKKQVISNQAGRTGIGYKEMPSIAARSLDDGEGGTLTGVSMTRGVKRSAIAITETADVVVRGNHLENNDAIGIYLGGTAKGVVEDNTLQGHKYSAIYAEGSASFTLCRNALAGNRFDGIELHGDPCITDGDKHKQKKSTRPS